MCDEKKDAKRAGFEAFMRALLGAVASDEPGAGSKEGLEDARFGEKMVTLPYLAVSTYVLIWNDKLGKGGVLTNTVDQNAPIGMFHPTDTGCLEECAKDREGWVMRRLARGNLLPPPVDGVEWRLATKDEARKLLDAYTSAHESMLQALAAHAGWGFKDKRSQRGPLN